MPSLGNPVTANVTCRCGKEQRHCDKTREIGGDLRRIEGPFAGQAGLGAEAPWCWARLRRAAFRRLHEACVFSVQAACVPAPVLRCGAVTTMCDSCAPIAARKSCCVIAGAASNAVAEVAAAIQINSRPVASTDENATVSMFNCGFKLFLAVAFMICLLSVLVASNMAPD